MHPRALTCPALAATLLAAAMQHMPAAAQGEPEHVRQLEEVIVSATKREQAVRDIPASINALSGSSLEEQGAQELADFLKLVPGVTQNPLGSDQSRVTIRGVGADTARLTTSQTTAVMIGETSFSDPLFSAVTPDVNPFDLASVEVLKGPQGTLFGSSGLSGALRYVPEKPRFGEWEGKLSAAKTNTEQAADSDSHAAAINIPLGGDYPLALRVVGIERNAGGIVDNLNTGEKDIDDRYQTSERGMLAWQPTNALIVDVLYMEQRTDIDETPFSSDPEGELVRTTTFGPSTQTTAFDIASITGTYSLGWADIVLTGSRMGKFLASDFDATRLVNGGSLTGTDAVRLALGQDVTGNTTELRLVSNNESRLRWIVGGFSLDYTQFFSTTLYSNSGPGGLGLPLPAPPAQRTVLTEITADIDAREIALFTDVSWAFVDNWEISIGLRDYKSIVDGVVKGSGAIILAATGSPEYRNAARISESGISPKLSLTWTPAENLMLYTTVSKGFRMGGIQTISDTPTTDVPETFKSDTLWNYEVGLRGEWFDNNLQTDIAVYKVDWDEPQLVQRTPDNLFNIIDNVGSAEIDGAELAIQYLTPVDGLSVNASAAYTDARTSESFRAPDGTPVKAGTNLPGTGLWQTALTLTYQRSFGPWDLRSSVTHSYVSDAYNDLLQNAEVLGYQSWDAHLSLSRFWGERSVMLALAATNLEDERGITNVLYSAEDRQDVYYIRPRSLEMRVSLHF